MRVYLASRYSRKNEISKLVPVFGAHGISVGSRWLHEAESPDCKLSDFSSEFCREVAEVDLEDIEMCDAMVFFSEDPLIGTPRGGRHVEFGYALALRKEIYTVGLLENVFHYLPTVTSFSKVEEALNYLVERNAN